jgi:hypothetical protein
MKKQYQLFSIILLFFASYFFTRSGCEAKGQELQRFYKEGKCGYKNMDGTVIINPEYGAGSNFTEGMALVIKNNKRGFINQKTKLLFHFNTTMLLYFLKA